MRAVIILTVVLLTLPVGAAQLAGNVVRVVDGDTIVVDHSGERHRVRFSGIDTPERDQPWGDAATREMRRIAAGKEVTVDWYKQDR